MFARLGVFVGGCTLEAAEAVCGPEALDGLATLMDQSLVTAAEGRFGMLETVREYALERLAESGGEQQARRRHAEAYAALAGSADEGLNTATSASGWTASHADRENIRAAVGFAVADGEVGTALRLAAIWRYWMTRGNLTDGRALVATALRERRGPPEARLHALNAAGVLASEQGDFAPARALFEESLELARRLESPAWSRARSATSAASPSMTTISPRRCGCTRSRSPTGARSGTCARSASSPRTSGSPSAAVGSMSARSSCWARASCWRAARRTRRTCPPPCARSPRTAARRGGRGPAGARALRESLALSRELGDRPGLGGGPGDAGRRGRARLGAELIGAAEGAREAAGASRQPDEERWVAEVKARLREALGRRRSRRRRIGPAASS